jgi:hypothetical protein
MKIRMLLWSGLCASGAMLATGAAFSGGTTTNDNRLVDFNQSTGELSAYPAGGSLSTYLHRPTTVHLPGNLGRYTPPDPCRPLAEAWNFTVEYDEHRGVTSTYVFEALLTLMSDLQCHATVTSTSGSPNPILVISPSAD